MEKSFIANWEECNVAVIETLENIPENKYKTKAFDSRFKTFAWEFACILTTRNLYINGLKAKKLEGSSQTLTDEEATSFNKKKMLEELKNSNQEIIKLIKNKNISSIIFFGEKSSKFPAISWLLQHEQLHLGKLMLYCSNLNIPQSKTFMKMWGGYGFKKLK